MKNILNQLKNVIAARFAAITLKFRNLTNRNYIRNVLMAKVAEFFRSLLDFKPRDKNDYYNILRWQVSKKLAYLIVVAVGIVSAIFLYSNYTKYVGKGNAGDGVKTYKYNSMLLRFAKGRVRIKGKSGYLAYDGEVEKGLVKGNGTLYDKEGNIVYIGSFQNNDFEGEGKKYYPGGVAEYTGTFKKNLYDGNGFQYRENGSLYYEGGFSKGLKEGNGVLYDNSSKKIYSGIFAGDDIVYSDMVGRSAAEIAEKYSGKRILYEGQNVFNVVMSDIDAMYEGVAGTDTLNEEIMVDSIYVLRQYISTPAGNLSDMGQLANYFGEPVYAGYSQATPSELIAVEEVTSKTEEEFFAYPDNTIRQRYEDYFLVDSTENLQLYITAYSNSGILYSFVSRAMGEPFGFYFMTEEETGEE